jgi:hypothetical protein
MTTAQVVKIRQMPKGGRKGGSMFPRVSLIDAIAYARKLVSKTHTGPQHQDVIFSGVVGAKGSRGAARISALKQYGFIKGNSKAGFSADELAKRIVASPPDELVALYRQAILKPIIFKKLFETFHGDTVSKAKLKQRAAGLKVHPDETTTCVDLYISSMSAAGLVTIEGDQVKHLTSSDVSTLSATSATDYMESETPDAEMEEETYTEANDHGESETESAANVTNGSEAVAKAKTLKDNSRSGPQAVFNVNVTLDSSLDIEKLQKQLELLKRFGAI